jgi:hypothetical protein
MTKSTLQVFQKQVLSIVVANVDILFQFKEKGFKKGKNVGSLVGQVFPQNGNLTSAVVHVRCEGNLPDTLTAVVEADEGGDNPRVIDFFWDE